MMAAGLFSLPSRLGRKLAVADAMRRHDFLGVLRLNAAAGIPEDATSLYAWYRLGCYRKAVELAKKTRPTTAREIVAVSASLAAVGRFHDCERLVADSLPKLRRTPRRAIEAANGVVRFMPGLALRICDGIPAARGLRSAAHLALGQVDLARKVLQADGPIDESELVAGHYFLVANLTDTPESKLEAVNRQLASAGLLDLFLDHNARGFALENVRHRPAPFCVDGPLVSIIVPAFDAGDHLRMSVGSLLQQSYRRLEIIIVDDGSRDGTGRVAEDLAAMDGRVRVLSLGQNRGAYAARNVGLRAATGCFVTVHDADDFAHCQKIERQVQPLLRDGRLVFTTSDLVRVSPEGVFARREVYPLQRLNSSSLTFRREAILRDCGFWEEERVGADGEFLFRLHRIYPGQRRVRLRQVLTFAADHPGSLTAVVPNGAPGVPADPRRTAYTEAYTQRWLQNSGMDANGRR